MAAFYNFNEDSDNTIRESNLTFGGLNATYNSASDVPVTSGSYSATGITVNFTLNFSPAVGTNLTVVSNTGSAFISGTFNNLAQGQVVPLVYSGTTYYFVANYYGGTGRSLVLQWADSNPYAWGYGLDGEMGNDSFNDNFTPGPVNTTGVLFGKIILSEAAGGDFNVALCSDGSLATWGADDVGELGDNNPFGGDSTAPVAVDQTGALAGEKVVAVTAGIQNALVLCADGTVYGWGYDEDGELGDNGGEYESPVPVPIYTAGVLAGKTVVQVSAGGEHGLALCSDGTVVAWGDNEFGQLGDGSMGGAYAFPVLVDGTSGALAGKRVVQVSAGGYHNLALCSDGTVVAWGYNYYSELGDDGTEFESDVPVPVYTGPGSALAGKTVVAVSAGYYQNIALCSDGSVACWGAGYAGDLGDGGAEDDSNVPVTVVATGALAGKTVVGISAGANFSTAICSDGTVVEWGLNAYGSLGDGGAEPSSNVPVKVRTTGLPAVSRFMAMTAGGEASQALGILALPDGPRIAVEQPAGTLLFGGTTVNFGKVLLDSTNELTFTISNIGFAPLTNLSFGISGSYAAEYIASAPAAPTLAAGGSTTFTVSFSPQARGARPATLQVNSNDPLNPALDFNLVGTGTGGTLSAVYTSGTIVPITAADYTAKGGPVNFTLDYAPTTGSILTVVDDTGLNFIHGDFGNLQQGQAVALTYNGVTYNFIANYFGGTGNDLVLQWADTSLQGWGNNIDGELGDSGTTDSLSPVAVNTSSALQDSIVLAASAGARHGLALVAYGDEYQFVATWGYNGDGELGDGGTTSSVTPVFVFSEYPPIAAVSAGGSHNLVLGSDGSVAAWGYNGDGELGDGSTDNSLSPEFVNAYGSLASESVIAVSAGGRHSLALCSDGTISAWGYGVDGELGDGGTNGSLVPVPVDTSGVLAGKTVVQISAGGNHSLALCADGTVVAWGANYEGQLGDGGAESIGDDPVLVDGTSGALAGKKVVQVSAGGLHSLALCSDGTVVAWGYNQYGELGESGTAVESAVPVAVYTGTGSALEGKTVVDIAAGYLHSTALCSDGTVVAWGYNGDGELGDSGTTNSPIPITVKPLDFLPGETFFSIASGSMAHHSFGLAAIPPIPQIAIQQPLGTNLVSGSNDVDFGSVGLGGTSQMTFTVANNGTGTLNILALTVSGTNGADFQPQPLNSTTLGPGGSTTLTVNFSPLAAGERTASLTVTSNDPVTPLFTVALSGSGLPTYTVSSSAGANGGISPLASQTVGGGSNVAFTATPNSGYVVSQWLVNGALAQSGGNSFTLNNVLADAAVEVTFAAVSGSTLDVTYTSINNVPVISSSYTATGTTVDFTLDYAPVPGTSLAVIQNTGQGFINGMFGNLTQGQLVQLTYDGLTYNFVANYFGARSAGALCNNLILQWAHPGLYAWGDDTSGELGNDSTGTDSFAPGAVDTTGVLAGETVTSLAAGDSFSVALCSDGTIAAWGYNGDGELGNDSTDDTAAPVSVDETGALAGKTVVAIAAGDSHVLALCSDGSVAAWGSNFEGQLGNLEVSSTDAPIAVDTSGVLSGETVVAISAGDLHSLALCADGTLVAWGYNGDGELGDGTPGDSPVPVLVDTGSDSALFGKTVTAISAGGTHSLALCSDGTIAAWGYNGDGELGNDGTTSSMVPVAVDMSGALAGKTVVAISAGNLHSLALCSDGTVVAWGYNADGELGNGGATNSLAPVAVNTSTALAGKFVLAISAGSMQSLALNSDGSVAAWGYNGDGELGNSGSTGSLTPTLVSTSTLPAGSIFCGLSAGPLAIHELALVSGPAPEILIQTGGESFTSGSSTADFGGVTIGDSNQLTFTINNGGSAAMTNLSASIIGADPNDFQVGALGATSLASGSATTLTVTFFPTATGVRSATLELASNDPVTPSFAIGLTGTGVAALTQPVFYFTASSDEVHSTDGQVTMDVTRNFSSPGTVDFQTVDDTAVAGSNYTATAGTLSFAAGQMDQSITVPILLLDSAPGSTFFSIQLSDPSAGAAIGTPGTAGIYILNDAAADYTLSQTGFTLPPTAPDSSASITVNLTPEEADGSWRLFGELAWRGSGQTATGLTSGNYEVEFKPVDGYQQPPLLVVSATAGAQVVESGTYILNGEPATGSLQVNIAPEGVGGWQLQGASGWNASGDTLSDLNTGDYIIEFEPVNGLVTPEPCEAVVVAGDIATISTTYAVGDSTTGQTPVLVSDMVALTQSPYVYTGQIQTDEGLGSGFVPLDRVVVTAAHVIFDDNTLSYVTGVRWFPQYESGLFETPPEIPVGSYVLDGYAAQRAIDNTPGVASAASRQLDAAALYFFQEADGGGYSGYLASDSSSNIWLTGARNKFIAGYPVTGVSPTGRLYATPVVTDAFQYVAGSVFSTDSITSYPGNSGGPLFVQFDNGTYYPAAIYQGGSGDTVVHSIDSDVIALMNQAELSANGGANNSGGGIIQVNEGLSGVTAYALGGIKVVMQPTGAASDGGYWEVVGDNTPRLNAESLLGLAPGSYTVHFATTGKGYTPPPDQSVTISVGTPTVVTGNYAANPPVVTSGSTATAIQGQPFSYRVTVTPNATTYSLTGKLPSGLVFDSTNGLISGTVSSSASLGMIPISLQATNTAGPGSTFTLMLQVAAPGALSVGATGDGKVPKAFLKPSIQAVGSLVTIKATPDAGYLFAYWSDGTTGAILSYDQSYTFTMPRYLDLKANFVPNPFTKAKGIYLALFQGIDEQHTGFAQISVNSSGGFIGAFNLGGEAAAVKNKFNAEGQYNGGFALPNGTSYTAMLSLSSSAVLTGTITSQSDGSELFVNAELPVAHSTAALVGNYTVVMPAATGTDNLPAGNGYGTIAISKTGKLKFKGTLGDGVPASLSTYLDSQNNWSFLFTRPVSKNSSEEILLGSISIPAAISGSAGTLSWYRSARMADTAYPAGFITSIPIQISKYALPAVTATSAILTFSGGDLTTAKVETVSISDKDKVTPSPPATPLSLSFTAASGLFSGHFLDGDTTRSFAGAILKSGTTGLGLFQEKSGETGSVVIQPGK